MSDTNIPYAIQEKGSYVKILYMVRIPNGRIIKGAPDRETLEFITGYAQVIPGLEKTLEGHALGDKLNFVVPHELAFGPRYPQLLIEKNRSEFHFPPRFKPYIGMELPIIIEGGEGPDTVTIRELKEDTIVVDGNHPLAGATLEYDLEIVEARPAKEQEICAEWEGDSAKEGAPCSSPCELILGKPQE